MSAGPHVMGQGDGVLSGAALRVAEARVDLDRMATLLADKIQGLSGQWVGAGGAAFQSLHAQWSETRRGSPVPSPSSRPRCTAPSATTTRPTTTARPSSPACPAGSGDRRRRGEQSCLSTFG